MPEHTFRIVSTEDGIKTEPCNQSELIERLGADPFDIADRVIEEAYPNYYNREKGWWGAQRIPNFGILRGAIASAIQRERSL